MSCSALAAELSVVVPTHLPLDLEATLEGLSQQTVAGFEVVLMENGARSAHVWSATTRWRKRLNLRYCHSSRAGLNRARNLGVQMASGEYIAIIDDDCRPGTDWVESIVRAHARHPKAGVIGGPVSLKFDQPPPRWLVGEFRTCLSELNWGEESIDLDDGRYLVGANISFRKSLHEKAGGFPEALGMSSREAPQLSNDEIGFFDRVRKIASPALVYDPDVRVVHRIPESRVSLARMFQRRFGQGVSDVALTLWRKGADHTAAIERYLNSVCPHPWHERQLRERLDSLDAETTGEYLYFHAVCRVGYLLGIVRGLENHVVETRDDAPGWIDGRAIAVGRRMARLIAAADADQATHRVVQYVADALYEGWDPDRSINVRIAACRRKMGLLVGMMQFLAPDIGAPNGFTGEALCLGEQEGVVE